MIPPSFSLFFTAAFVLAVTPGPGMLYVLTRSIKGGRREGYFSSLGTMIGGLVHVVAAALGLSALLATSAIAFEAVRYAGAGYLVFLGIRTLLQNDAFAIPDGMEASILRQRQDRRALLQGITTEVLNPKTALFFLAFIPQFIDFHQPAIAQFLVLGCLSVLMNSSADLVVATLAGPIGSQLSKRPRLRRWPKLLSGSGLIALGAYTAFSGSKQDA